MNEGIRGRILDDFRVGFPRYRWIWRNARKSAGDVEMDAPILEAFDVPAENARDFMRETRELRKHASELLGEKLFIVTHTPEATSRHYENILKSLYTEPVSSLTAVYSTYFIVTQSALETWNMSAGISGLPAASVIHATVQLCLDDAATKSEVITDANFALAA